MAEGFAVASAAILSLLGQPIKSESQIREEVNKEWQEWADDVKRLTREIDVELNGENAARQASLCDLVGEVSRVRAEERERCAKEIENSSQFRGFEHLATAIRNRKTEG